MKTLTKYLTKIILGMFLILNLFSYASAEMKISRERDAEIRKIIDIYQVRLDIKKDRPIADYIDNFKSQICSASDLSDKNININKYIKEVKGVGRSFSIKCDMSGKTYLDMTDYEKNQIKQYPKLQIERDIQDLSSGLASLQEAQRGSGLVIEKTTGGYLWTFDGKYFPGDIAFEKFLARFYGAENVKDSKFLILDPSDFKETQITQVKTTDNGFLDTRVDAVENSQSCIPLKNNFKFKTNNKTYKSNDKNSNGEVTKLQNYLYANGYLKVKGNGNYGPATVQAVKDFQKVNNLIVTGVVGEVSRNKINEGACITVLPFEKKVTNSYEVKKIAEENKKNDRVEIELKEVGKKSFKNKQELSSLIKEIEADLLKRSKNGDCEKEKEACDMDNKIIKSLKDNCINLDDNKVEECVLGVIMSVGLAGTISKQKEELKEAAKSKENYIAYLTKSGLDFKDGSCDFDSNITSGHEAYGYTETCSNKRKSYVFSKEVNSQKVSISRDEYVDYMYNLFVKSLPKLLESY
jgi:hypothetical protein